MRLTCQCRLSFFSVGGGKPINHFFFLNDPAPPEIYPLPQHAPFPIPTLTIGTRDMGIVAHQAASRRKIAKLVDRRECRRRNQRDQSVAMHVENRIASDQQGVWLVLRERCESAFDPLLVADFQNAKIETQ